MIRKGKNEKTSRLSIFLKGIIGENPVLVLVLGTCPALAQTGSFINALSMGIAATFVLISSNTVISALRKLIPDSVRIPCYIVIIAASVSLVQMIMNAYFPALYDLLGVFLALIAVNCIILGRAEMFARKNSVIDSFIDGAGMGIGFLLALAALAAIREVFGAGTLTVIPDSPIKIPILYKYNLPILTTAPGGFLVFGMLIALVNKKGSKNGVKKATRPPCAACPSANLCGKMPYDNDASEIREEKI